MDLQQILSDKRENVVLKDCVGPIFQEFVVEALVLMGEDMHSTNVCIQPLYKNRVEHEFKVFFS